MKLNKSLETMTTLQSIILCYIYVLVIILTDARSQTCQHKTKDSSTVSHRAHIHPKLKTHTKRDIKTNHYGMFTNT